MRAAKLFLIGFICLLFIGNSAFGEINDQVKSFSSDYNKLIQEASSPDYFQRFNDPRYQEQISQQVQDVQSDLSRIDFDADRMLREGKTDIPPAPTGLPSFSINNSIKFFADNLEKVKQQKAKIEDALSVAKDDQQKIKRAVTINGWVILFKAFGTNIFTPIAFNGIAGAITELTSNIMQNFITAGGDKAVESKMVKRLREMQSDPAMKELDDALQEAKKAAEQPGGMKDSDIFVYQAKLAKGYKKVIDNYTTLVRDLDEYIRNAEEELRRRVRLQRDYEEALKRAFRDSKWLSGGFKSQIDIVRGQQGLKPAGVGPAIQIPPPSSNANPNDQQKKAAEAILKANDVLFNEIAGLLGKQYKSLAQIINERSKNWKEPNLSDYSLRAEVPTYGYGRDQILSCLNDLIYALSNNLFWQPGVNNALDAGIKYGSADQLKWQAEAAKSLDEGRVYFLGFVKQVDSDFDASFAGNQNILTAVRQKLAAIKMTGFEQYDYGTREKLKGVKQAVEEREKKASDDAYKWKKLLAEKGPVLADLDRDIKEVADVSALYSKIAKGFGEIKDLYAELITSYKEVQKQGSAGQILSMLDKGAGMERGGAAVYDATNKLAKGLGVSNYLDDRVLTRHLVAAYQEFDIPVIGYLREKIVNSGYLASPERKTIEKFYGSVYVSGSFMDGNRIRKIAPIDEIPFPGYQSGGGGVTSRAEIDFFDKRVKKMEDDLAFYQKNVAALRQLTIETNKTFGFMKASYKDKALGAYYNNVSLLCYDFSGQIADEFLPYADLVDEFRDKLEKLERKAANERSQVKISEDIAAQQQQRQEIENRRQAEIGLQGNRLRFCLSKSKEILRDMNTINSYFKMAIAQNNIATAKSLYLSTLDRKDSTIANKSEADQSYAYLAGQNAAGAIETDYYKQIGSNDYTVRSMISEIEKTLTSYVPDVSNIKESSGNVGQGFDIEDIIAGRGPAASGGVVSNGTASLNVGENFSFSLGGVTTDPTKTDFFYAVGNSFRVEYSDKCAVVDVGAANFSSAPILSPGSGTIAPMVVGHYYAFLTLDGKYGKVQVTGFNPGVSVNFTWWYQPDGSRQF
ncbi:MAG: hypothetical protein NT099_09315 [Candidatus Saganbacteria bacterium]|nr:hypothetical protein [Candidatus Saganbacteria bacterium]